MNKYFPWQSPFRYNEDSSSVEDSAGNKILDIRGWGYLTGKGDAALGMSEDAAMLVQNTIAERVVQLMNKDTLE